MKTPQMETETPIPGVCSSSKDVGEIMHVQGEVSSMKDVAESVHDFAPNTLVGCGGGKPSTEKPG